MVSATESFSLEERGAASVSTERVKCCLCAIDESIPIAVGEDFEYQTSPDTFRAVQCTRCSLVYLDPRPTISEFARIYPPTYHAFQFREDTFGLVYKVRARLEARRLLSWCSGLPENAKIVDIGCGDGFHLKLLKQFGNPGFTLHGIDADPRAAEAAARAGVPVHLGTVQDCTLSAGTYDLAMLIQTIEHVDDPPGLLRDIRRLLKVGGKLVIVTDNVDSFDFHLFKGRHWGGYHFPRHWNLFSSRTLRALALKADLEVLDLSTMVSPVNWVYSIRNLLVDFQAPDWLVNQFSLEAPLSLSAFTAYDTLNQLTGRGALLRAILRKARDTPDPPRPD
jgi:SAM-dependent methyltransferase